MWGVDTCRDNNEQGDKLFRSYRKNFRFLRDMRFQDKPYSIRSTELRWAISTSVFSHHLNPTKKMGSPNRVLS